MEQSPASEVLSFIDEHVDIALARLNFWEYVMYMDGDFFTRRSFLKQVADGLQWLYEEYLEGRARTMANSLPPRSGKSYILSLFCSWWLGKLPEQSVMRNACTDTLYTKFSYDVRAIVKSDKYLKVFPNSKLAPDKQNVGGWNLELSKQVGYFGGGVGGTIIGFGANLACSDDLYKDMMAALSEQVQITTASWKQSAHNSRMEKNCPEIYMGTRWTKNDEIGKAIEEGRVDLNIVIPALIDGVSFCEDVKSTAEYLKIKNETDEGIWEAEYMQNPVEVKGLLFPSSELKYFDPIEKRSEFRYLAVDPADAGGDDTSAPFCELYGDGIYVTDVLYNNNGTDVNIPSLVEKIVEKKLNAVEIEGVSAWVLFAKDVRNKVMERYQDCEIRVIKNSANKQTRILAQSAFIKNHFYFLKEEYWTPEYRKFMNVLTRYLREGKSKKDDAPDSLAMAAVYFIKTFGLW